MGDVRRVNGQRIADDHFFHHNNFAEGEIFSARPITMITRLLRQPFFKTTIKEKTKCLGIDVSFAINILLIPNPKLYFYFHRKEFRRMKNNFFTLFFFFFPPPKKSPPPKKKKKKKKKKKS